jgi:hypothetical protein
LYFVHTVTRKLWSLCVFVAPLHLWCLGYTKALQVDISCAIDTALPK